MRAIHRKLLRDLWRLKVQALAIALVQACGVAVFVMATAASTSLRQTRDQFFERARFAHAFVELTRAPRALADSVAALPGVARVETRITEDVLLDIEGLREPATGRLISIPPGRPGLNRLSVLRGRRPSPGAEDEVLVTEGFAEAHGFEPGDAITAVINGRRDEMVIVGTALTPEWVFVTRPGDIMPDAKRFGVMWMEEEAMAAAFDMEGAFNSMALALSPDARAAEVLAGVDALTEKYGGLGAYERGQQASTKRLNDEIDQFKGMATIPPFIFLAVSAFLLKVVMARLIGSQREQIAALKAFGYSRRAIGLHYGLFVLAIVGLGTALGTGVGIWLGRGMTETFTFYFRFPEVIYRLDLEVALMALALSGGAAVLGVRGPLKAAMDLPPAEAMRPEAPKRFRPTLVERLGLGRWLSPVGRMILRQLERSPGKSAQACLGIALAVAVVILGSFVYDAAEYVKDFEFFRSRRFDASVSFLEPRRRDALHELRGFPGVLCGEAYRAAPVRLSKGTRSRKLAIMGLEPDHSLMQIIDREGRLVALPPAGVVLSDKLASILGVAVGEEVVVEVLEGARPVRSLTVTGLVASYNGVSATMSRPALNRFLREGDLVSGAFLSLDSREQEGFFARCKATPQLIGVTIKHNAVAGFQKAINRSMSRMRLANVIFAAIIAFGVVYNTMRIALSERSRELSTLRVLGFSRSEVANMLLGEIAVIVLLALPLGLVLGTGLAALAITALETETQSFPFIIEPGTYAFAAALVSGAALISGLTVRRRIDELDLIAVLKARD